MCEFKIAVVDDEEDIFELVKLAFEEAQTIKAPQYRLDWFQDGKVFVEHCREKALPNLVILDLKMPIMNGFEVLEQLRKDARLQAIPVVVLSSSDRLDDIHVTYSLGARSFITKPKRFESLVEVAESLGDYWFLGVVKLPIEEGLCGDKSVGDR